MDIKLLEQIGLTESEIKVYFALMKLGSASTGPIIDKAKINHSKIYLILNKLLDKGLVSFIIKNKVKHYQASDPDNLLRYLKSKKESIAEQEKELEKLLPELKMQQQMAKKIQKATIYTGYEGIKTIFNLILSELKADDEYYAFTLYEESSSQQLRRFFLNYHQKRADKKIKVKLLTMKRFKKSTKDKYPQYPLSERRFIDIKLPTGLFIFKDYVMHFIWSDNPTVFVIQSAQNTERFKEFFLELWNQAIP